MEEFERRIEGGGDLAAYGVGKGHPGEAAVREQDVGSGVFAGAGHAREGDDLQGVGHGDGGG